MTDRPILFSGPMIRALLEGRKTQTRRILKPQPPADMGLVGVYAPALTAVFGYVTPDADFKVPLRYMPGVRLWVRESLADTGNGVGYVADGTVDPSAVWAWKRGYLPSIHMPRGLSRLTLIVTDVRVQRLQEISEADAKEEGAGSHPCGGCGEKNPDGRCIGCLHPFHTNGFQVLWDSLNAKPRPRYGDDGKVTHYESFPWGGESVTETYRGKPHHIHANPWVAALTFNVIRQNIDAMGEAE
ncbi:hypothetical protein [Nitratireductor sp. GZWM139]|uniref:hypothetical protein n=1 Tax=Nitratireductor sp. GZWM139 TaxID=2950541 RepID=UPI0024BE1862|nr:hypothetical protein [Nitratireductor sp. GZWM139]MDJ1465700.1 hypothetical protein [Nitratireductor sp. GZWM139]